MRKSILVYSHDCDPQIHPHKFAITPTECEQRLRSGWARYISPKAIQLNPPPGWTPDQTKMLVSGLFNQAWRKRYSDCYLVWQMRSNEP